MGNENLEKLLDLIAEALIVSEYVTVANVTDAQKFIRNGQLQQGSGQGVLALFQKDIKANQEDLINSTTVSDGETSTQENLQEIANNVDFSLISIVVSTDGEISISGGGPPYNGLSLTNLLTDVSTNNSLNVSQFIPLSRQQSNVNVDKAEEFLDTNIFELLPTADTRQARIIRFFGELNALLPTTVDDKEWDSDTDGMVDRANDGTWINATEYNQDNSISYVQDNTDGNIDEEDAFIHRLTESANDTNKTRTIEEIYNRIVPYLRDILEDPVVPQDGRPVYRNQSSGYLQFRNPNQGIIIRNTNQDFVEGLNPTTREYLKTGFTITQWVRFKDKVSEGTLFNFGNPTRTDTPFGFKLETYVVNGNELPIVGNYISTSEGSYLTGFGSDGHTWKQIFKDGGHTGADGNLLDYSNGNAPQQGFFADTDTERFVRLVVRDEGNILRGSHVGMPFMERRTNRGLPELGYYDNQGDYSHAYGLMTNVKVPTDFNEWYFICATYNPNIDEDTYNELYTDQSGQQNPFSNNKDFWMNHINPDTGEYTVNSGYGNQCKVEIISRSDLLRARGFKV